MARFTEQLRQVLHRFNQGGGLDITLSEIAAELGRNRATIHSHLQRLVDLGYLSRPDYGRYVITDAGRSVLESRAKGARSLIRCPDCGRKITI